MCCSKIFKSLDSKKNRKKKIKVSKVLYVKGIFLSLMNLSFAGVSALAES